MILNLQPYPKYKDSGVEWLGRVPVEWEAVRNKAYLRYRKQAVGESSGDYTLLSLTLKGVTKRNMDNPQGKFPAEFNTYQVVNPGDLIFCLFDMDETPRTVGLSNHYGMITGAYDVVFSTNQNATNYLYLYFLSIDNIKGLKPLYTGLRKVIPKDVFMSMKIPMPSTEEQTAIVHYLNYTNSRIQQYIATKQKLIKLLEEQKQAIIHQAVTGAIDVTTGKPYPKYKDSGVKWLGKVPEAWEMRRLRTLATMIVSNVDKHTIEGETSVRLCNYVDVYKNERITNEVKFMKASVNSDELTNYKIKIGDVILTKDSETWTDIGVPSLVEYEADDLICGYHLAIVRPFNGTMLGEFILRLLQNSSIATQLHVSANGVTRYGLSHGDIKDVLFPIPTINEQKNIINYLNINLSLIDKAINRARKEIVLLQEYRIRLIADVVTGKVDVREAAKNMPAEVTNSIVDDLNNDDAEDNEMLDAVIEE